MLQEELPGHKAVVPHLYDCAVVDGIAQVCQGHVELVHPVQIYIVHVHVDVRRATSTIYREIFDYYGLLSLIVRYVEF